MYALLASVIIPSTTLTSATPSDHSAWHAIPFVASRVARVLLPIFHCKAHENLFSRHYRAFILLCSVSFELCCAYSVTIRRHTRYTICFVTSSLPHFNICGLPVLFAHSGDNLDALVSHPSVVVLVGCRAC